MRLLLSLIATLYLTSVAVSALAADVAPPMQQFAQLGNLGAMRGEGGNPFLESEVPGGKIALPPGARVERDVAYGADPKQRMDVYIPANATNAPVMFMVHGGAWFIGDKGHTGVVAAKVANWLPKGYVFISVNYRLLPNANPVQQADDVGMALAYAQNHAASWGADPARFLLMGHSAGAHLVALINADPSIATRQGAKPWVGTIALDSAALDLVRIMEHQHYRFYDRIFHSDPAYWREASPLHRLTGKPGPMLLVCSSQRADSCDQAQAFAAKATEMGGRATVLPVAMKHGDIGAKIGLPGDYTNSVQSFITSVGLP